MQTKRIDRIIDKLFCKHDWEHRYTTNVKDDCGEKWVRITLICNKCGKIKRIKRI